MKKKLTVIITPEQAKKVLSNIPKGSSISLLAMDIDKILNSKNTK